MKKISSLACSIGAIAIIFFSQTSFSQDTWVQKANFGGTPRSGVVSLTIGNKGYMGTGYDGSLYQDFWQYDPSTDSWTQEATFPGTARFVAVGFYFSVGTKGYIGTGWNGSGYYDQSDFWEYDQSTNVWTQKANFGGGQRNGAVGFSIGNKGYIGTGFNITDSPIYYHKDFWEYDPATDVWTRKANLGGAGRQTATGFSIGLKGYIGLGTDGSNMFQDFWEYDQAGDTWTQKSNFPATGRQWATAFSIGTKGYMGTGGTYSGGPFYNDLWEWDQTTDVWIQRANFRGTARTLASGFAIGGKAYLGTGYDGSFQNDFWQYTPCNLTANAETNRTICFGQSTTLGSDSVVSGLSYAWSPSSGLNDSILAHPIASPSVTTTYTLTIKSSSSCSASASVTVTVNPLPLAVAGNNATINSGQSVTLGAAPVAGDTYNWLPTAGLDNPSIANPIATPSATTTYTLFETTPSGCSANNLVIISVYKPWSCASDARLDSMRIKIPGLDSLYNLQNIALRNLINNPSLLTSNPPYKIPIVVHVIYQSGTPYGTGDNISYAQIQSEIAALNAAYRKNYPSYNGQPNSSVPVATDCQIEFCLARNKYPTTTWPIGPYGVEYGVIRHPRSAGDQLLNYQMTASVETTLVQQTLANLPPNNDFGYDKYLNIWTIPYINSNSSGFIGYAPNPLQQTSYVLDGVVIRSDVFGDNTTSHAPAPTPYTPVFPYLMSQLDQGKILAHEIGHYFNLLHTFQPGNCNGSDCHYNGDMCCDTPPTAIQGPDCFSSNPPLDCNGVLDQNISNYMSYSDDNCMNMFTNDQSTRINTYINFNSNRGNLVSAVNGVQTGIIGTGACFPPALVADINSTPPYCINSGIIFSTPTTPTSGYSAISWNWLFPGGSPSSFNGSTPPLITYNTAGTYPITLTASDGTNSLTNTINIYVSSCAPISNLQQGNWFFGKYAGINFISGVPVPVNPAWTFQTINTFEGDVTESNPNTGQLIYYSDGSNIWNENHGLAISGLNGGSSKSELLSVPAPGFSNRYYLFTSPIQENIYTPFQYSIIDHIGNSMSIVGSPNINAVLPTGYSNSIAEQITAIPHCNGTDYWIIVHGGPNSTANQGKNKFFVYLLSSQGLTNKNASSTAPDVYGPFGGDCSVGKLKASPDGKHLALATLAGAYASSSDLQLFNFDNSTGVISNQITLVNNDYVYGCSFDPSSRYLYASLPSLSTIVGFDLNNITAPTTICTTTGAYKSLQLGPDGVIYAARSNADIYLSSINPPFGLSTSIFQFNAVNLTSGTNPNIQSTWSLPNMIDAIKPPASNPSFAITQVNCSTIVCTVDPCWANYSASWNFGDGSPIATGSPVTHTYTSNGNFNVSLTLTIGTSTLPSVAQQVSVFPVAPTISGPNPVCTNLTPPANYAVPSQGFSSYIWTVTGGSIVSGQGTNNINVNWANAGNGNVSVALTGNNCSYNVSLNVTIYASPIANAGSTQVICQGAPVVIGGSPTASGGTPPNTPYTYLWTPSTGLSCTNCANPIANTNTPILYNVLVTDAHGCTSNAGVQININGNPPPNVVITPTSPNICAGQNVVLTASGATSYSWSPATGLSCTNCANPTANPASTTVYTVIGTNASGCTNTANVTVTVNPVPHHIVITPASPNICAGQNVVLTASGATSYSWSPATGLSCTNCANPTANPASTTVYTVIGTNASGCTNTANVTITVNPLPNVVITPVSANICAGQNVVLTASGATSYSWSPATGLSCTNCANPAANPASTTVYTVIGTNASGCTNTSVITITVNPFPVAAFTITNNEACMGNATPFIFTNQSTNGTSYAWNFGDGSPIVTTSTATNQTHIYSQPGQYVVILTVQSGAGCCTVHSALASVTPSTTTYNAGHCSQSVTYSSGGQYVNPNNSYSYDIYANGLINPLFMNLPIRDTIFIHSGALLVIQNKTVHFGPWGKIIVLPGGTLELDANAVLTGLTCGGKDIMWQGIEVWGDASKNQTTYASSQGKILVYYNCTISNAHNAITLGKFCPDPFLPTQCNQIPGRPACNGIYNPLLSGGIINTQYATSCSFINNAHNIRVAPYSYSEVSFMKNCVFTGGVLLDPGYKIGGATYQYPNTPRQQYFALANTLGRTYRMVHLWKVSGITFTDNSFSNAEMGIEEIDASSIIVKASLGNTFTNMNRGINASYSSSSPFFGNTITGNTFNNTNLNLLPSAPSPQPIISVYLSGSQNDAIKYNFFGINTNSNNQNYNPNGIWLDNSSGFTIWDNQFFLNKVGIEVNNSNTGGGVIKNGVAITASTGGNVFNQCKTSIQTDNNNNILTMRCNATNNNVLGNYSINWSNTGLLATQGLAGIVITYPAGNRFNMNDVSSNCSTNILGPLRQIKNTYSSKYIYYSHNSPLNFIPCNTAGVGVTITQDPIPCTNLGCCPKDPCYPPVSKSCWIAQITNINQQISTLQIEFNNVLANLDKGQTAQLIAAINLDPTPPGDLKNMLLNVSPLSDMVLLAFINRTVATTPPGIFKDVMMPNSPVSDNVLPALQTKLNSLPSGIAQQIQDAQSNSTYRTITTISREISAWQVDLQNQTNQLLSFYVANDSAQAINLLQQENSIDANQKLLGTYIGSGNISAAQAQIANMTASTPEDQAFLDLQNMLLTLEQQGESVFDMDAAQQQLVRNVASMSSSLAQVNACAILNLVFNEACPVQISSNARMSDNSIAPISVGNEMAKLFIFPNPFGNFTIVTYQLPEEVKEASINIYDITGKKIGSYDAINTKGQIKIEANNFENGMYFCRLEAEGNILATSKMIIIK